MTDAERILWAQLRAKRFAEAKFSRQAPIGPYVADFCSFKNRLVIEVDGGQHDEDRKRDETRTASLNGEGFAVIRFWNSDVTGNLAGVMFEIDRALKSQMTDNS